MSRRKSSNTAGVAAPARAPATSFRKPQADLYTVLLVVALLAILVGILFMYLEMNAYDFKYKGGPPVSWKSSQPAGLGEQRFEVCGRCAIVDADVDTPCSSAAWSAATFSYT